MNLKNTIGAFAVASVALSQVALAHDPREGGHGPKKTTPRVPITIESIPPAEVKKELPKIRFHELDLNGDRQITRKEWKGRGSSFRKLDKNKDGLLSGIEVEVAAKASAK